MVLVVFNLYLGTPEMFDVRVAACVKFAPLWAVWHKTNYKKLYIEQHADILRLSPAMLELWKQTWTTGSDNHKLNIDETIEFVNGDLDKVCCWCGVGVTLEYRCVALILKSHEYT